VRGQQLDGTDQIIELFPDRCSSNVRSTSAKVIETLIGKITPSVNPSIFRKKTGNSVRQSGVVKDMTTHGHRGEYGLNCQKLMLVG